MIGGEGEATDVWMTNGQWVEYGKQFNAILFQVGTTNGCNTLIHMATFLQLKDSLYD